MRRLLLAALAVVVGAASFSEADARMRLVQRAGTFRTSAANSTGYVDSSTASINGAVQTVDTAYVDISDIKWENFSVGTGQFGAARIWFTAPLNTSVDTLFFAIEPIAPDGQPVSSTTFNYAIATTAGDEAISALITSDSDYIVPNLAFCKSFRVRVRADGNTSARFLAARVWMTFYTDE